MNRLCADFVRLSADENLAKKGVIRAPLGLGERRSVNWRPRSSMRRGAKSKGFQHLAMRSRRCLFRLSGGAGIANWDKVARDVHVAGIVAGVRKSRLLRYYHTPWLIVSISTGMRPPRFAVKPGRR